MKRIGNRVIVFLLFIIFVFADTSSIQKETETSIQLSVTLEQLKQLARTNPKSVEIRIALADALMANHKYEEAATEYLVLYQSVPGIRDSMLNCLSYTNQLQRYLYILRQERKTGQFTQQLQYFLYKTLWDKKLYDEVYQYALLDQQEGKETLHTVFYSAMYFYVKNDFESSYKYFISIKHPCLYDFDIYFYMADIYLRSKDYSLAILHLQKANDVTDVPFQKYSALFNIAFLYSEIENFPMSLQYYKYCLSNYVNFIDMDFYYKYVLVYCEMNDHENEFKDSYKLGLNLLNTFESTISENSGRKELSLYKGLCYYKAKRYIESSSLLMPFITFTETQQHFNIINTLFQIIPLQDLYRQNFHKHDCFGVQSNVTSDAWTTGVIPEDQLLVPPTLSRVNTEPFLSSPINANKVKYFKNKDLLPLIKDFWGRNSEYKWSYSILKTPSTYVSDPIKLQVYAMSVSMNPLLLYTYKVIFVNSSTLMNENKHDDCTNMCNSNILHEQMKKHHINYNKAIEASKRLVYMSLYAVSRNIINEMNSNVYEPYAPDFTTQEFIRGRRFDLPDISQNKHMSSILYYKVDIDVVTDDILYVTNVEQLQDFSVFNNCTRIQLAYNIFKLLTIYIPIQLYQNEDQAYSQQKKDIFDLVNNKYEPSLGNPLSPIRRQVFYIYEVVKNITNNVMEPLVASQHFYSHFKLIKTIEYSIYEYVNIKN